jgi:hypothetical protein
MSRIFSVRINLDEINASLLRWRATDSRADWLDGFLTGCSGVDMDGSEPFTIGNKIGMECHAQAVAFQGKQRGKADKRWSATAMPRQCHGIATAMPRHSHGNATAMPEDMPRQCQSNNRIIEESNNEVTVNHAREAVAVASTDFMEGSQEAPATAMACERRSFADWRIIVAHRIFWTREEDDVWKGIYGAEGWDEMTKAYRYLETKHPAPKKLFLSMFQEMR